MPIWQKIINYSFVAFIDRIIVYVIENDDKLSKPWQFTPYINHLYVLTNNARLWKLNSNFFSINHLIFKKLIIEKLDYFYKLIEYKISRINFSIVFEINILKHHFINFSLSV